MRVLSLFDGIGGARLALERADIIPEAYLASEIDQQAIDLTSRRYPEIIQVGPVENILEYSGPKLDLLIGGSPCQDISRANGKSNLHGPRSILFFEFLRLKEILQPKYFLLENVVPTLDVVQNINRLLGVKSIFPNSLRFSFQKRERLYWTNIPVDYSKWPDVGRFSFQDVKEKNKEICENYLIQDTPKNRVAWESRKRDVTHSDTVFCATTKQSVSTGCGVVDFGDFCRTLTVGEVEQAQTYPVGYLNGVPKTKAFQLLGNSFMVDVISFLLKGIKAASQRLENL